jgi:hypothetical protein
MIRVCAAAARSLPRVSAPASLWERVETALDGPSLRAGRQFALPGAGTIHPRRPATALAAILVLVLGAALLWGRRQPAAPAWQVEALAGSPTCDAAPIGRSGRLKVGQWLETDRVSRARMQVAAIGEVHVEPNTRIRFLRAREREHHLALERGKMHAQILAPPRLFFVETPSAVAVDMGCAYTLEVDEAHRSLLRVTAGRVALVRDGRESVVPAGGECRTRPETGPGTPYFADASEEFQRALSQLDFDHGGAPALAILLAEARPRDAYTLWHLFPRVAASERGELYDRLAALEIPPEGVTRAGILRLDAQMLDRWRMVIEESWWDGD